MTTDLPGLFEATVANSPDAPAAVAGEMSLTYGQLETAANRVAHRLQELGVGCESVVGLCVRRGLDLAVGVLGALKAGGACLPLDPAYPTDRLAFMIADASPQVILTSAGLEARLLAQPTAVVRLDEVTASRSSEKAAPPPRVATPDGLAYVIYTSGSTGQPNGVMLTHGGLVNHARAAAGIYGLGPGDRILQFCSISFDVSVEEMFPTWAAGATVISRGDETPILGRAWLGWLRAQGVTVVNLPTAHWHAWVRDLASLGEVVPAAIRTVIVGGEKALGTVYRDWLAVGGDRARWFNAYGPTEACVMATIHEGAVADVEDDPPIGWPLPGAEIHLLDQERRPVPPGDEGEIYIGGAGLARGYLGRPALTAERFVSASGVQGGRLYRTGDLGRLRPDGELEFCGRADDQVKVRGFRIECGEVESHLRAHPSVSEAVVVAREDSPGDRRLVAYVVPSAERQSDAEGAELRRFLATRLPAYMVPSVFVPIDAPPLTSNGKVDRAALPAPQPTRATGSRPLASSTEEALAAIWADVLGVVGIGPDDDFFALGGHSLLAAHVVARVQDDLGPALPLHAVFDAPTVAALAAMVDALVPGTSGAGPPALVAQHRQPDATAATFPLSLAQEQMWAVQARSGTRVDNNVTVLVRLPGPLDADALRSALVALVDRHESLRTTFACEDGRPVQSIAASVPMDLAQADLSTIPRDAAEAELHQRVATIDGEPFDPLRPPLFRFHLFTLDHGGMAVLTFDHLVCDGPSAYIIASELAEAYQAFAGGNPPGFRALAVGYSDFAVWQRRWFTEGRLAAQLEYWERKLAGMPLGPALPFDHIPATPTRRIAVRPFRIDPATVQLVERLARGARASTFVVCVAAVSAVLSRLASLDDILLSTTLSGRGRPELEGVVGNFAGTGRLRTDLSGDPSISELVARARETVRGLLEHSDIPFFNVRDVLAPTFAAQGARGRPPLALLPIELQYFRAAHDHWAPGISVVERPSGTPGKGPAGELFFRGQLHPLSITFFDDGSHLWGQLSYKVDFYEPATIERLAGGMERAMAAAARDPLMRVSALPVGPREGR